MKDGKIVNEIGALRWKTYSYLTDNNEKYKKPKAQKSVL